MNNDEQHGYDVETEYNEDPFVENDIMLKQKFVTPKYENEKIDLVLGNLGSKEVQQLHILSALLVMCEDSDELKEAREFFEKEKGLIINMSRAYAGKTLEATFQNRRVKVERASPQKGFKQ